MTPVFRFAHMLGRIDAGWRFASADLRRFTALALIRDVWDIVRRDAGPGHVGPAHEAISTHILFTEDPRRDAVLLWLADHAAPVLREAAAWMARMVDAETRFGTADLALLEVAGGALAAPVAGPVTAALGPDSGMMLTTVAGAVDRLRVVPDFLEAEDGGLVRPLAGAPVRHRVASPSPGAAWALNLAMLADSRVTGGAPPPIGIVSRALFHGLADADAVAGQLMTDAVSAGERTYRRLLILNDELARGGAALAHLSRNARARDAWGVVAALQMLTRRQLGRALTLSRGGADMQMRALAGAGLATLQPGGVIDYALPEPGPPAPTDASSLAHAVEAIDRDLAAIDRLNEGVHPA